VNLFFPELMTHFRISSWMGRFAWKSQLLPCY